MRWHVSEKDREVAEFNPPLAEMKDRMVEESRYLIEMNSSFRVRNPRTGQSKAWTCCFSACSGRATPSHCLWLVERFDAGSRHYGERKWKKRLPLVAAGRPSIQEPLLWVAPGKVVQRMGGERFVVLRSA